MTIALKEVKMKDLELVLAWRNNPEVYQGFYEQGYLGKKLITWEEHQKFWSKHLDSETYKAWKIYYEGKDVGIIWLDRLDNIMPEVGIYIGETTLHGKGVGKEALTSILKWLKSTNYQRAHAKILKSNKRSIRLFTSCGFARRGEAREGEWLYECNI